MPKELRKSGQCTNCSENIGDFSYCPHCGQLNTSKQVSLRLLLHDFLEDYFTFDSKFFKSLIPLLIKPGFLTQEYNKGRRVSYILPLRLYFFITLSLHSKITADSSEKDSPVRIEEAEDGSSNFRINNVPVDSLEEGLFKNFALKAKDLSKREDGGTLFWTEVVNQIPKVMFIILPVFALILKLLYVRHEIYYINHLIFSLHVHSIIFLYLLLSLLLPRWYTIVLTIFGIWFHVFFSMRHVYRQSIIKTALKLNTLLVLYVVPLVLGFALLAVLAVVNV